jgi:BASS family bile acid:Na+ symporter
MAHLIPLAISLSMGLIVLALGLHASVQDATSLFRQPGLLARSILAMNVIMVAVAVVIALLFDLHPAIKIALGALALSPVPPILPNKQVKAGGATSYVAGLLAATAVCAIVLVPVGIELLNHVFGLANHVPAGRIASVVFVGVILPLAIGMALRHFAPDFAETIARPVSLFATLLLVAAFLPVLVGIWPLLLSMVGNGTLIVLVLFALIGVAVGHWLGGPDPDDRTVLALATSARHPGVAMAIAAATFPNEKAVIAVVFWHLVVSAVVCIPYVNWRKRMHAAAAPNASLP